MQRQDTSRENAEMLGGPNKFDKKNKKNNARKFLFQKHLKFGKSQTSVKFTINMARWEEP
jgi:hypothetical protein